MRLFFSLCAWGFFACAIAFIAGGVWVIANGQGVIGSLVVAGGAGSAVVGLFCAAARDDVPPRVDIPEYKPRPKLKVVVRD